MIIKTYGLFDGVAKTYVRTFTSTNDETAQRAVKYIVREQGFDKIAGRDYVVTHLYDMDTETGAIVDNSVHTICSMANEIEALEAEQKQAMLDEFLKRSLNPNSHLVNKEVKEANDDGKEKAEG